MMRNRLLTEAVNSLHEHLSGKSWFNTIGVGGTVDKPMIHVYVLRHPMVDEIPLEWHGFQVNVSRMGRIKPA